MKGTHLQEKVKTELMAEAERLIDEALVWDGRTESPTLTEIEDEVLRLRKQFGQRLASALIERQEQRRPVPGPRCGQCGEEMQYKDMKDNEVESRVGALVLRRGYYYCSHCRCGLFPPG